MIDHPDFDLASLTRRLEKHQQGHLLRFWDELQPEARLRLGTQLQEIDFPLLDRLLHDDDSTVDFAALAMRAKSPPSVRADGTGAAWSPEEAIERGKQVLRSGEVAVLIVAGGQGTRLGFDQPKGMFPIGPVSGRTLFQGFADQLRAIEQRYGKPIPLLLMTSEATQQPTIEYLEQTNHLGLDPQQVHVFRQGTMPAVDAKTGQVLLADKDAVALSPDGHGGTVKALNQAGLLQQMNSRGIKHLFYAQVDNPLVPLCDPSLLGHHLMAGSDMTTQVIRKRYPTEKVGNVVLADGRVQIIEYSDLPEAAAELRDNQGELKLWAGNIAVHVLEIDFLIRSASEPDRLPFHRASKKVSYIDDSGTRVDPDEPNATKFERFIFDLLPAAENAFVVEGIAAEVFAPVKNADGAPTDTPSAARQQISDLHRGWLRTAGVEVASGAMIEINPTVAMDQADVIRAVAEKKLPAASSVISGDQYFC